MATSFIKASFEYKIVMNKIESHKLSLITAVTKEFKQKQIPFALWIQNCMESWVNGVKKILNPFYFWFLFLVVNTCVDICNFSKQQISFVFVCK